MAFYGALLRVCLGWRTKVHCTPYDILHVYIYVARFCYTSKISGSLLPRNGPLMDEAHFVRVSCACVEIRLSRVARCWGYVGGSWPERCIPSSFPCFPQVSVRPSIPGRSILSFVVTVSRNQSSFTHDKEYETYTLPCCFCPSMPKEESDFFAALPGDRCRN